MSGEVSDQEWKQGPTLLSDGVGLFGAHEGMLKAVLKFVEVNAAIKIGVLRWES